MNLKNIFVSMVLIVSIVGCWFVDYEDVSHEKEYSALVGERFTTLTDLQINGVTMDRNYKKQIDLYTIYVLPGFSGPEVVSSEILKSGTDFEILKVLRCTNCLFENRVEIVIKITSNNKYNNAPVEISYDYFKSEGKKIFEQLIKANT